MPRQVRIEYEGAVYHVMCRGNHREAIFEDDTDRGLFLATLAQACAKTGWRVHGYAMMGNHYHLLLDTPEANLVAGMTWFQSTYTKRYNARHSASGQLFAGATRRCWWRATARSTSVRCSTTSTSIILPFGQALRSRFAFWWLL